MDEEVHVGVAINLNQLRVDLNTLRSMKLDNWNVSTSNNTPLSLRRHIYGYRRTREKRREQMWK